MRHLNILKITALIIAMTSLSACSSMHSNSATGHGKSGAYGGGGVSAYGLGKQQGFDSRQYGFVNGKPTKQTYHFDFDSSQVNPTYFNNIKAQAHYLAMHPNARVRIEGDTDERGSREYNVALGEQRADSIENLLLINGASRKQITVVSYGEEKPIALGHNEAAYRLNRRADLIYTAN